MTLASKQILFALISISGFLSISGSEPYLSILPSSRNIRKPIGQNMLLTCAPSVDDPSLISNFMWLDIHGRPVEKQQRTKSRVTSEDMTQDNTMALIINSLQENDAGNYTCQATYAGSRILKKTVHIETIVGVTWEDAPKEQYPELGKDFKVRCKVTAKPAPRVEWKINDDLVKSGGRFIIETDGLLIQKVQRTDDGVYTCRAFVLDTGELVERHIKVEVHIPPKFETPKSETKEVVDGETANLGCKAIGKPDPTYKWIKGSTREDLALTGGRFAVNDKTGDLTITRVSHEDNSDFICLANNAAGRAEKVVRVNVIIKPQVLDIRNVSFAAGSTSKLICQATGNPLPSVTFRKLSSQAPMIAGIQPNDDRIIVNQNEDPARGYAIGTLTIDKLERKDDGLYACVAKNKGGEAIKNGHITVEFRPTFANSPMKEAWSWDRRPVNITCIAEAIPNATITWRLHNRDIERDPNFRKFNNEKFGQSTLLVTPSDKKFYGHYTCIGRNMHGEAEHTIVLKEATIPSEILQAKLGVITATTITFSFIGPSNHGGRPVKAYVAQYKKERQSWQESLNRTWPLDSSYILEGLEPQTLYLFRFAALNDVGLSSWGANQQHTMPKRSFPEEPTVLNKPIPPNDFVVSPYSDRFELRWKKPADNGEYIDRYEIGICMVRKINNNWEETEEGCITYDLRGQIETSTLVDGLRPDNFYKIEIRAHNAIGFSTPGQVFLQTARGSDPMKYHNNDTHLSSTMLISVVVASLFIILVIVDISCFFVNDTGILRLMCGKKSNRKNREEDAKLSSLYSWRFPLPYCSNKDTSSNESGSPGNSGNDTVKVPLPDMNFVFEAKELLNNGNRDGKIRIDGTETYKRDTSIEYDVKKSISKTSFVGKDSAV